jgi:hypothetical protein
VVDRILVNGANISADYQLYNMQGQLFFTGQQIERHSFAYLPAGVYFLKIMDGPAQKTSVKHFIKQ